MYDGKLIIGEVKTKSPAGFISKYNWDYLFKLAENHKAVDVISIHTDPRYGGDITHLLNAREKTDKKLMAKGWYDVEEMKYLISRGIDYVLAIDSFPNTWHARRCLFEPEGLEQLTNLNKDLKIAGVEMLIWNARDISNVKIDRDKKDDFKRARKIWTGKLVQASRIKTIKDIRPGSDGVLVGSYLVEFLKSIK